MRRSSPACGNVTCGCCSCRKEPVGSCCWRLSDFWPTAGPPAYPIWLCGR
jgi:hypothetical protein